MVENGATIFTEEQDLIEKQDQDSCNSLFSYLRRRGGGRGFVHYYRISKGFDPTPRTPPPTRLHNYSDFHQWQLFFSASFPPPPPQSLCSQTGIQTFLLFQGIVKVTVSLSKFRNSSFFVPFPTVGTVHFCSSFSPL